MADGAYLHQDQGEPCARPDCRHMRNQLAQSVPLVEWEAWREVAIALVSEIAGVGEVA